MRCKGIKNNGEQCTRDAEKNSKYCWQHQPDVEDVGGQRPKFETPAEMQKLINDYFDSCFIKAENKNDQTYQKQIRPFTVTGLAYSLGMTRKGLLDYQGKNEEFSNTIMRAKTRIEMYVEEQLFRSQGKTNGVQFNLKNNFNWKDKQEIEHDINNISSVEIELIEDES